MSYQEFAQLPASEKITLCKVNANKQYKIFQLESGDIYSRSVNYFVTNVKVDGFDLEKGVDESLETVGSWYFDAKNLKLYIRKLDDQDPKFSQIIVTHQFFFSNTPVILPYNLIQGGEAVEWSARIPDNGIGNLGQQLDDESTGTVLESSSSIKLINSDGYFDEIFDTLIWENQDILFYSWFPRTPISEAQKLFEGVIESKDFSAYDISFKVKDFVFRLKNQVILPLFSELDGTVAPSLLGTPKRRIYGQFKQLKCSGIDSVLDGIDLTGTVSVVTDSESMTGTGTSFLDQLSPGDEIFIPTPNGEYKVGIESIESDTALTLGKKSEGTYTDVSVSFSPNYNYRKKNRKWHIAGHLLRAPSTEIDFVYSSNRVRVISSEDLFAGVSVKINNEYVNIRRVSGNQVVLNSALSPKPLVGDLLGRNPVSKVYFQDKELIIDRDWTLVNNEFDSYIVINDMAEVNIVEPRSVGATLSFASGSRVITTSANVDLRTILKPRDWIRKNSITETTYYEILDVKEQTVTIRTPFVGVTESASGLMKIVNVIQDDSLITVDCLGMEANGEWIKTPSQAVRHLVMNDAGFTSVNEDSFNTARAECDYILSLAIPELIGEKSPPIKDVITKINESIFGSLYGDSSWSISYSILNSKKPESLKVLRDDDILSFSVSSDQKIINSIKVNFRPFTDIFTGESAFEVYQGTSAFVDSLIGIRNSEERTIYLFEEDKARIIGQRIMFFKSLSNSKVTLVSTLNLALTSVNDKLYLDLDRMYKRYGGNDRKKIGVVTGIKKNGMGATVDFIDLGGIYNRVPSIAPNSISDYATATRDDIARYGYCVDNHILTPDPLSELELGNNLIG